MNEETETTPRNPTQFEIEAYRQAHETRRKWENYIWQWSILLTVVAAVFSMWKEASLALSRPHKVVLFLLAFFVLMISLNVWRARVLMKRVEKTICELHSDMGYEWSKYPVIPYEIDKDPEFKPKRYWYKRISSTRVAVYCHLAAAAVFFFIAFYALSIR